LTVTLSWDLAVSSGDYPTRARPPQHAKAKRLRSVGQSRR